MPSKRKAKREPKMREIIHIVGGPLDGERVSITRTSSRQGFFVHIEGEGREEEMWWGYYDHQSRTPDGRRIFGVGKHR